MSTLERLAVEHDYYCSTSNYHSDEWGAIWETMTEFLDEFEDADEDYNLCFRWDIMPRGENGAEAGRYQAEVFLLAQRKGIFMPHIILHVNEAEAERFLAYARRHWQKLRSIWVPISEEHDND